MRTGHLFAGAGGGLYADLILGHQPVFAVEWDNHAAGALQQRADEGWFPGLHVHHGDVQLFDTSGWKGRVDSIHAGFPCTDISLAGNGAGIEGEHSGLWKEVERIADDLRPGELFLENSPAITSRGLGTVLGDLANLGYDAKWCVLPASAVGAPHLRARWWCLARRANTDQSQCRQGSGEQSERPEHSGLCQRCLANTDSRKCNPGPQHSQGNKRPHTCQCDQDVSNTSKERLQEREILRRRESEAGFPFQGQATKRDNWWATEPSVGRVVNGMANRSNRIKALGNGQVPLQAAASYRLLEAQFGK